MIQSGPNQHTNPTLFRLNGCPDQVAIGEPLLDLDAPDAEPDPEAKL